MLELTGICCGGMEAIDFMESLPDVIPEKVKTNDFCEEYEKALNRFRYEVAKGIGKKKKVNKAVVRGHSVVRRIIIPTYRKFTAD